MPKIKIDDCAMLHTDIVKAVRSRMYSEDALRQISRLFKIMGDPTRCNILCALNHSEMCVCALGALLNMSKSAISHQLRLLREAKLVRAHRDGKNVFYTLDDDHVKAIFSTAGEHVLEKIT